MEWGTAFDGDRIYGGAVNMAARVCALSGPDEILVSAAIHHAADARDDVRGSGAAGRTPAEAGE